MSSFNLHRSIATSAIKVARHELSGVSTWSEEMSTVACAFGDKTAAGRGFPERDGVDFCFDGLGCFCAKLE
jgi:hypothetical protein